MFKILALSSFVTLLSSTSFASQSKICLFPAMMNDPITLSYNQGGISISSDGSAPFQCRIVREPEVSNLKRELSQKGHQIDATTDVIQCSDKGPSAKIEMYLTSSGTAYFAMEGLGFLTGTCK